MVTRRLRHRTELTRRSSVSRFWRLAVIVCLVAVGTGILTNSSSAATPSQTGGPAAGQSPVAVQSAINKNETVVAVAPPGYQQQLTTTLNGLATVATKHPEYFSKTGPNTAQVFAKAAQYATALTPDQVNGLYSAFGSVSNLNQIPGQIVRLENYQARVRASIAALRDHTVHRVRPHDDFNPTPPNDCSTKAFAAAIYGLIATHIVAEIARWIGERIAESLPDSEVFGIIVLGEGTVLTLPISPERAIAEAIIAALDLVSILADGAKELMEECNLDNFQEAMFAFKNFVHAFVPVKTLQIKVVPASAGTQFLVTATEDGIPVNTTVDWIKAIVLGSGGPKVTDVTTSTTSALITGSTGVLLLTPPTTPSAAAYELQVHSTDQTDPTSTDPGQQHSGVATFTKTSG